MTAAVSEADNVLEEVNRILRRLEAPDADHHGAGWLSVMLRAVAEAQARLFRSLEFRIHSQDAAITEIRQQSAGENARRSNRLVELTEILAGHGAVLVELQQYRKDEPMRRRSLLAELESRFQGQEAGVVEIAQRFGNTETMVGELRKHAAEMVSEMQQLRTSDGEMRTRVTRCKDEILDLWRLEEEVTAKHSSTIAALQQQQQRQAASLAELQRWCAGRQRSRVQRLEAEITCSSRPASCEASPLSSAAPPPRGSASPSPSSRCITTGGAVFRGSSPRLSEGSAMAGSYSLQNGHLGGGVLHVPTTALTGSGSGGPLAPEHQLSPGGAFVRMRPPGAGGHGGVPVVPPSLPGGGRQLKNSASVPSFTSSDGGVALCGTTASTWGDLLVDRGSFSAMGEGSVTTSPMPALSFGSVLAGSLGSVEPIGSGGSAALSTGSTLVELPRPTVVAEVTPEECMNSLAKHKLAAW